MHFDILPDDDGPENLDVMEFDAFITYRYQHGIGHIIQFFLNDICQLPTCQSCM